MISRRSRTLAWSSSKHVHTIMRRRELIVDHRDPAYIKVPTHMATHGGASTHALTCRCHPRAAAADPMSRQSPTRALMGWARWWDQALWMPINTIQASKPTRNVRPLARFPSCPVNHRQELPLDAIKWPGWMRRHLRPLCVIQAGRANRLQHHLFVVARESKQ